VLTRVARSFSERGFINFPTAAHKKIAPIDTWHTNAKYCAIIRLPHGSGGGKEREMVESDVMSPDPVRFPASPGKRTGRLSVGAHRFPKAPLKIFMRDHPQA